MRQWIGIFICYFFTSLTSLQSKGKTYSEEEFEQAVMKATEQKLKRVQVSNLSFFSYDLLKKELELNKQERLLEEKKQQLKMSEKDFIGRVKKFGNKQQKFLGCLNKNEQSQRERMSRLVKVVEGMSPKRAAELLSIQESEFSVQILAALDTTKTAKIFNLMKKEISARLQKQYVLMKQ